MLQINFHISICSWISSFRILHRNSFQRRGGGEKKKKFLQDQPTEIKKKIFSHAFHKFEISSPCITSYTRYKESIKNIAFDQFKVGRWKVGRIAVHVAKKIHWLLFQKRHSITWNVAIRIEAGASMCVKTLKQAWTARVSTDSASKDLPA